MVAISDLCRPLKKKRGFLTSILDLFRSRKNTQYVLSSIRGIAAVTENAVNSLAHHLGDLDKEIVNIVAFEHAGDALVRQIHDDIDEHGFMMRPSPEVLTNLVTAADNVLDEIRKTAQHAVTFKLMSELAVPEATQLVQILVEMVKCSGQLVQHVTGLKKSDEPGEIVMHLNDLESKADELRLHAELRLADEYSQPNSNFVAYDSRRNLYRLLEHSTDAANHLGVVSLSIIRKEGY